MPTSATVLEAVGTIIDTNSATLTLGTNLFLGKLPESPDLCVAVYEYAGTQPLATFGATAIEVDRPSVQVVVRAAKEDYPAARNLAQDLRLLLAAVTDSTVGSQRVVRLAPSGSVLPLGVDDLDRPRIAFNLDCFMDM